MKYKSTTLMTIYSIQLVGTVYTVPGLDEERPCGYIDSPLPMPHPHDYRGRWKSV